MTVQTMPPTPTRAAVNLARKPSLNRRFPPLADRTSLPARLTGLSRQKLAREATAPDPDVRRCLAHFRLHVASVEWTNNDVNQQINSIEMEDDDEEDEDCKENETLNKDEETTMPAKKDEELVKPNNENGNSIQTPPSQASPEVLHVSFEVHGSASDVLDPPITPCEPKKDEGLLERGRNCLEKTVQTKNFWSASGQCVPVSIAS